MAWNKPRRPFYVLIALLRLIWRTRNWDWRVGQMIANATRRHIGTDDPFYVEDEDLAEAFDNCDSPFHKAKKT